MLKAYGRTDKGMVRQTNQDCYAIQRLEEGVLLAVVCDGMGGAKGGNVASRNAVNIISQNITSNYRSGYDHNGVRNMMMCAVSVANALVYDMARKNEELYGMGTTVVLCVAKDGVAHVLHAGDSRAYLLRGEEFFCVTKDHSMVQMLVENGELTEEQARIHPKKHVITRALGVESQLETDYAEFPFEEGDELLLCTDGLSNHLEKGQLLQVLRSVKPEDQPQELIGRANAQGGSDNITAVVLLG